MTKKRVVLSMVCVAVSAVTPPVLAADGEFVGSSGADVIVGVLPGLSNHGAVGGIRAYSIGTTSCNIGNAELNWLANDNRHPVIGGNLYQVKDGRLRQLGYSWLKHGFTALQQDACGLGCQSSGTGTRLGVGCSDPYDSSLNGGRPMGLRREVNATRGYYPNAWLEPSGSGNVAQRMQVEEAELSATDASYFYEAQYVTADDAMNGNGLNNASYRQVSITTTTPHTMSFTGPGTVQMLPAIYSWAALDPQVNVEAVTFTTTGGAAPAADDRFPALPDPPELLHVATRIHDDGATHRWEFAVHNLNSHRSVQSVSVPIPPNATVSVVGFHDVDTHSGEEAVISNADWSMPAPFTAGPKGGSVTWSTQDFATNPNANAIRWGTTYSFWLVVDAPPASGSLVTLGLFRPGSPSTVTASMVGALFEDGFEAGDTSAWSSTVP